MCICTKPLVTSDIFEGRQGKGMEGMVTLTAKDPQRNRGSEGVRLQNGVLGGGSGGRGFIEEHLRPIMTLHILARKALQAHRRRQCALDARQVRLR